ncbi:substrate-binding domain-containing protein [Algibacter miyuki]|uniref:Substrate-binding domain-containing protein n=1 Tax=Algibacter miyuki TaxID=1306933 RepID=A0ABV5H0C9_9FLAO|nr:LacI family DNA-binding transcriptional regulator [Algibacter miyuki]MDN3667037.1 LacI family DNA-binding transcriptional regulator [Algibacter miyuki]
MITIKDIAKEAQVSEGTVDRVIHNRGGVSKKTEAKIKALLEHHNFSVNPVASALAMKNKYVIASLMPKHDDADLFWKSPYLGVLKAENDVKSLGVQVTNFAYNQYDEASYFETFTTLLKSEPSAVIMVPNFSKETSAVVAQLEAKNIPYIFLNIDIKGFNNLAFVGQDSYMAGYITGKLMHLSRPKSDAFLIIQARHNITKNNAVSNRIKGFNDYFLKNNIPVENQTINLENLDNSSGTKEKINTYLNAHPEVKGLFVPSSRIYIIVDCIDDAHLKNLELIGFDNTPQNIECLLDDSVAFLISQKPFDQGYEAVRLLTDYLVQNKIPNTKTYLPIDILIKENVSYNERKESLFEHESTNNSSL